MHISCLDLIFRPHCSSAGNFFAFCAYFVAFSLFLNFLALLFGSTVFVMLYLYVLRSNHLLLFLENFEMGEEEDVSYWTLVLFTRLLNGLLVMNHALLMFLGKGKLGHGLLSSLTHAMFF